MVLVISNPCSIKFKSIFSLRPIKKAAKSQRLNTDHLADHLSYLPEEILLNIFVRLDDPTQFLYTSRYLASLACSSRFIAHRLSYMYSKQCALYCALTRHPSLCDDNLIRCLIKIGVHVPRYLLQMFIENYHGPRRGSSKSSSSSQTDGRLSIFSKAISQIPFSGYAALVSATFEIYGDVFPCEDNDFTLFIRAIGDGAEKPQDDERLRNLMVDHQFIPLPLPEQVMPKFFFRQAVENPNLFVNFLPAFRVDKHARYRLWECAILNALDCSFSGSSVLTKRKAERMQYIAKWLEDSPPGGAEEEKEIFKSALTDIHKRYPSGYISSVVMAKVFGLVNEYIKPGFGNSLVDDFGGNNQSASQEIRQGFRKFMDECYNST